MVLMGGWVVVVVGFIGFSWTYPGKSIGSSPYYTTDENMLLQP